MFLNREDAARRLSLKLLRSIRGKDIVVIALPRGAVVMGKVIAEYLEASWDVVVLKKIGAPRNPELAIGVVGPNNTFVWNMDILKKLRLSKAEKEEIKKKKENERYDLEKTLREKKRPIPLKEKTIILVDDGVATGATVMAARKFLLKEGVKKIILATPVIAKDTFNEISKSFDRVVTLRKPEHFFAVGQYYLNFPQVSNKEVIELLK